MFQFILVKNIGRLRRMCLVFSRSVWLEKFRVEYSKWPLIARDYARNMKVLCLYECSLREKNEKMLHVCTFAVQYRVGSLVIFIYVFHISGIYPVGMVVDVTIKS